MQQPPKSILGAVLICALVLTGCGSSDSPATPKAVPIIALKSSAVAGDVLPARYTCDGKDIAPPLKWGAIPADAGTLALFLVAFTPEPATKSYKLSVEWAVAGVNPELHQLAAGHLPAGAYLGVNSSGKRQRYSICPKKGTTVHYQFEAYGVPSSVKISPQFAGISVLNSLTAPTSATRAVAHGAFVANYKRA